MFKRSLIASVLAFTAPALADPPIVQNVVVSRYGDLWRFDVTLRHNDTGWGHYADAWRVVTPDGQPLGTRNLAHPHVKEQPFTRSLSGVRIPEDITEVGIQARDNVDGWADAITPVRLR
ncbi:hypothetical protein [Sulfitobacter sp. PS-8MA]|uniref:hypothetical protein n=1 Tax=Sulfitobacter sp. PS-8MA TaxID=3237707 RepID=UPI0034C5B29F